MFETLNLLPKTTLKIKAANRTVAALALLARVVAVVFFLIVIAELALAAYTSSRIQATRSRSNALRVQITDQGEIEGRYLYAQQVLNSATSLVESRRDFLSALSDLYSRLESGVAIEGISFTANSLLFSGTAPNVQVFAQTLANFRASKTDSSFGKMVLDTSSRLPDGKYSFKVEIELLSAAKK